MNKVYISWLPLAATITLLCGLIYVVAQQNYRSSANDPQIQIAQDVANQVDAGQTPLAFVPTYKIEVSKSLATYIMIFDKNGKLNATSALINGKNPELPSGVFVDTKKAKDKETRFTWQPANGIREALVVNYFEGKQEGFVAVGRSLKEVEKRESSLMQMILIGWLVTLGFSFILKSYSKKIKN